MSTTTVYKVRLYNIATDETTVSRRMATPEGAAQMGGSIIEGTGYVIDLTELEAGNEWTPLDFDTTGYKPERS